ncbi:MAG: 50S ribosomal protein L9 [Planctomycetota bacterium]
MADVEILLQRSVKNLGLVGDVLKVRPGYARNFLFPKKLAVPASEDAKRQISRRAARVREEEAIRLKEIAALIERIESLVLKTVMKSDANGNLYGSVNAAKIVSLAKAAGANIEEKDVRLEGPIKSVGAHRVRIHVRDDEFAEVSIEVEGEGRPVVETPEISEDDRRDVHVPDEAGNQG